jgi:ABC-type sulfate/molybdate transport systems ATPase subunit
MGSAGNAETAVLEFSLHARRGNFHLDAESSFSADWTVLFGPSCSGKSTLLRMLAGLDAPAHHGPESARVVFDGGVLNDSTRGIALRPGHRKTTFVAQQPALFPHLSVTANIEYGLRELETPKRARRVEEVLEVAGAQHLVDRHIAALSGGEAQRVALARALAPMPLLLLLDEPFSALDGEASDEVLARLQPWLAEYRIQTVLATHDATDAFAVEAVVALLHLGRLAGVGPAQQVLASEGQRLWRRLRLI